MPTFKVIAKDESVEITIKYDDQLFALRMSFHYAYDLLATLSAELEAAYGVEEEITEGYVQTS